MNVLFVPSIGLDVSLLNRLADSVDYPVKYKVAFNNGPEGALDEFGEKHPDWIVKDSPVGNRGVAGSWNDCAKWFSSEPCWLIMNEDAWLLPGYLEQICKTMDANLDAPVVHLNDSNAYYAFGWGLAGRERFGEFDENIWCGYYEDVEMRYRHRLEGVTTYPYALQGLPPLPHGKPKSGGVDYNALIQSCGLLNRAYMIRKWGTHSAEVPIYDKPYKDQRLSVKDVVWYPEERAARWPIWECFLRNPKLYD